MRKEKKEKGGTYNPEQPLAAPSGWLGWYRVLAFPGAERDYFWEVGGLL